MDISSITTSELYRKITSQKCGKIYSFINQYISKVNRVNSWNFRIENECSKVFYAHEEGKIYGVLYFILEEYSPIYYSFFPDVIEENTFGEVMLDYEHYQKSKDTPICQTVLQNDVVLGFAYVDTRYRKKGVAHQLFWYAKEEIGFDENKILYMSPFSKAGLKFVKSVVKNNYFYHV